MGRKIVAAILGILAMGMTVGLVEGTGHALFPPPAELDLKNPEHLALLMQSIPLAAKVFVLLGWISGALIGSLVAGAISRAHPFGPCMAVAVAMLVGTTLSLWMIPHPWWMAAAGLLLPLPIAWGCAQWLQRRSAAAVAASS